MRTLLCALTVLALAGCGGKDLSGKAEVPSGYKQVKAHGASFAVPSAFQGQPESSFKNGATRMRLSNGDRWVDLIYHPADTGTFDAVKREYRVVFTTLDGGEITQDKPIDVEHASAGNLIEADIPDKPKLRSVQVRRGKDTYVLIARGDDLGPVIDSFRVEAAT